KSGFGFQKRFAQNQRQRTIADFAIFRKFRKAKSESARHAPKRGAPVFQPRNQKAAENHNGRIFGRVGGSFQFFAQNNPALRD
ncbi:MAG TPA: hypothetical protein P5262_04120, partial [Candidatus Moranbacteria bacterium]|nr:hypothetical protein [Candidatus Moranbacteria bacterium]